MRFLVSADPDPDRAKGRVRGLRGKMTLTLMPNTDPDELG